jgi:hypothetical protein
MSDLTLFEPNNAVALPDYLNFEVRPIAREIAPAQGADYISLKGNRFRCVVNGQEMDPFDTTYLDVVIVGSAPHTSRVYYDTKYDPNAENVTPACYSADGKKPSDNARAKQAAQCDLCPQNIKGSSLSGDGVGKACAYFRRLAVIIVGDPEGRVWRLDVKAKGLFGTSYSQARKFNFIDYAKAVSRTQFEFQHLITRLSFDSNESVPKLLFEARSVIDPQTAAIVKRVCDNYNVVEEVCKVEYRTASVGASVGAPAVQPGPTPPTPAVMPSEPQQMAIPFSSPQPSAMIQQAVPAPAAAPTTGTTANIQRILEKLNASRQAS